jgi:hypothetical protein
MSACLDESVAPLHQVQVGMNRTRNEADLTESEKLI